MNEDESAEQRQRKQELLVAMGLHNVPKTTESLKELMDRMSQEAQSRGLTPEILESILSERPEEPPNAHRPHHT